MAYAMITLVAVLSQAFAFYCFVQWQRNLKTFVDVIVTENAPVYRTKKAVETRAHEFEEIDVDDDGDYPDGI